MINELILRVDYLDQVFDLTVDSDVPLRVEMSAVEVGELGKFFGIGSQTFSIPGTKESNRFFNHAYDLAQDDVPAMYDTIPCSVILNGETVMQGSLQLMSVVSSEDGFVTYNVQVADKVVQFEAALANKLIGTADWSAYTHTLSSSSIVDSWDGNLLGGAVFYPVVDYGRSEGDLYAQAPVMQTTGSATGFPAGTIASPSTPMNARQALPAIRVKDTLDVIFNQVGFNYTGSFTATEDFNNLYILNKPNEKLGIVTQTSQTPTFHAFATSNQTESIPYTGIVNANGESFDPTNSYDAVNSRYVVPESGNYIFNARITYFNPLSIPSPASVRIIPRLEFSVDSGATWNTLTTGATTIIDIFDGVGPFVAPVSGEALFTPGTWIRAAIDVRYWFGTSGSDNITFLNLSTQFSCTVAPTTYEGATVELARQWQNQTKSLDVLKGILSQFNLVMTPQPGNGKTILIETFDTWIRSGEIKDWTSKFNTAKRIEVEHTVGELERELFLQNEDDSDRFSKFTKESSPNLQYGTLRLLAENNVSQGTKKIGDYFSPVVLAGAVDYVYPSEIEKPFQGSYPINVTTSFVLPHLYKFENSVQESYTIKPRIGYKVTQGLANNESFYVGSPADNLHITASYGTIANLSSLPVNIGITNDLHYNNTYPVFTQAIPNMNSGKNNFINYWRNYLDSIYWEGSKKVTLDLFFEPYEYKNISLNDRIIIKNQAYRINKISGFNISTRDVVTVELIKLYPGYWQVGATPTPTPTPTPTITGTPTPTPTPGGPTFTPTPTPTPTEVFTCEEVELIYPSNAANPFGTFYWTCCDGSAGEFTLGRDQNIIICARNGEVFVPPGGSTFNLGSGCTGCGI